MFKTSKAKLNTFQERHYRRQKRDKQIKEIRYICELDAAT